MSTMNIKRCCNSPPEFICVYDNDKVILVCEEDLKKIEYRTGVHYVIDYETKKKLDVEVLFS